MPSRIIPTADKQISELDFGFDGFNKQKVLRGVHAYARLLDRLIRKRKGSSPSEPDMGVDLDSYRFSDIDTLTSGTLENLIRDQTSKYIPDMPLQSINVSSLKYKNDYILYIQVVLIENNQAIQLAYQQRKGSIINMDIKFTKPKLINMPKPKIKD